MVTGPEADSARLTELDAPTRALARLAASIAAGGNEAVEAGCREALAMGVGPGWVDELLLQSVLMVGWPRALNAAAAWRRVSGLSPAPSEDGGAYDRAAEWRARGEAVCRTIYGPNYEKLRQVIGALHPALDAWMLVEGYGRTLGRPGLDLARRELCVVAQVAVQGALPQLHSHMRGALRAGAAPSVVGAVLEAVRPWLGPAEREQAGSLLAKVGA